MTPKEQIEDALRKAILDHLVRHVVAEADSPTLADVPRLKDEVFRLYKR